MFLHLHLSTCLQPECLEATIKKKITSSFQNSQEEVFHQQTAQFRIQQNKLIYPKVEASLPDFVKRYLGSSGHMAEREYANISGVCYISECDYNHYVPICISLAVCFLFNWVIKQLVNTMSFQNYPRGPGAVCSPWTSGERTLGNLILFTAG